MRFLVCVDGVLVAARAVRRDGMCHAASRTLTPTPLRVGEGLMAATRALLSAYSSSRKVRHLAAPPALRNSSSGVCTTR